LFKVVQGSSRLFKVVQGFSRFFKDFQTFPGFSRLFDGFQILFSHGFDGFFKVFNGCKVFKSFDDFSRLSKILMLFKADPNLKKMHRDVHLRNLLHTIVLVLLLRSPCKVSEPYDNSFW
jgi:hypothetical protein